jgi:peptidoglycan hydrolase-like protein with peptidoglycan-binding domain
LSLAAAFPRASAISIGAQPSSLPQGASSKAEAAGANTPHARALASSSKTGSRKTAGKRKRRARRSTPRAQRAPTPDRIKEIQAALARAGYYQQEPTGKWDEATKQGMRRFQEAKGLNPTGKIDAPSLQKLGLGSEIAGRFPPRPSQEEAQRPLNPPQ